MSQINKSATIAYDPERFMNIFVEMQRKMDTLEERVESLEGHVTTCCARGGPATDNSVTPSAAAKQILFPPSSEVYDVASSGSRSRSRSPPQRTREVTQYAPPPAAVAAPFQQQQQQHTTPPPPPGRAPSRGRDVSERGGYYPTHSPRSRPMSPAHGAANSGSVAPRTRSLAPATDEVGEGGLRRSNSRAFGVGGDGATAHYPTHSPRSRPLSPFGGGAPPSQPQNGSSGAGALFGRRDSSVASHQRDDSYSGRQPPIQPAQQQQHFQSPARAASPNDRIPTNRPPSVAASAARGRSVSDGRQQQHQFGSPSAAARGASPNDRIPRDRPSHSVMSPVTYATTPRGPPKGGSETAAPFQSPTRAASPNDRVPASRPSSVATPQQQQQQQQRASPVALGRQQQQQQPSYSYEAYGTASTSGNHAAGGVRATPTTPPPTVTAHSTQTTPVPPAANNDVNDTANNNANGDANKISSGQSASGAGAEPLRTGSETGYTYSAPQSQQHSQNQRQQQDAAQRGASQRERDVQSQRTREASPSAPRLSHTRNAQQQQGLVRPVTVSPSTYQQRQQQNTGAGNEQFRAVSPNRAVSFRDANGAADGQRGGYGSNNNGQQQQTYNARANASSAGPQRPGVNNNASNSATNSRGLNSQQQSDQNRVADRFARAHNAANNSNNADNNNANRSNGANNSATGYSRNNSDAYGNGYQQRGDAFARQDNSTAGQRFGASSSATANNTANSGNANSRGGFAASRDGFGQSANGSTASSRQHSDAYGGQQQRGYNQRGRSTTDDSGANAAYGAEAYGRQDTPTDRQAAYDSARRSAYNSPRTGRPAGYQGARTERSPGRVPGPGTNRPATDFRDPFQDADEYYGNPTVRRRCESEPRVTAEATYLDEPTNVSVGRVRPPNEPAKDDFSTGRCFASPANVQASYQPCPNAQLLPEVDGTTHRSSSTDVSHPRSNTRNRNHPLPY